MPLWKLQREISSEEFTELLAFKRLYTWQPDLWFGLQRHAFVARGGDLKDFVPIKPDETASDRKTQAAEDQMDADSDGGW
ncbi:hypothetical protein [Lacipirellula sp.]|uniref:hypothetical protein n=1 Tax=Lacipirellula sp. TaxID=2691419 RepID=UPI003D0BCD07